MITKTQRLYNLTTGIKIQVSNLLRIYKSNNKPETIEAIDKLDMAYNRYLVESEKIENEPEDTKKQRRYFYLNKEKQCWCEGDENEGFCDRRKCIKAKMIL